MGKIDVPDDRPPFAGPVGVAVEVEVLVAVVAVAVELADHHVVDRGGEVEVVVGVGAAGVEGQRGVERGGHRGEVAVVLVLPGLLLRAGGQVLGVDLVEGAFAIETVAVEQAVVAVLDEVHHAVEGAVELGADGKGEVVGGAGQLGHLVAQGVAGLGLVGVVREQVEVFDRAFAFLPDEAVVGVGIEVVAFLGEAGGGLAVDLMADVVVEAAEVVAGTAEGGGGGAVGGRSFDEPFEDRQLAGGGGRVRGHGAEVLGRIGGVGVGGELRDVAGVVLGFEAPAEHLAGGRGGGREVGGIDAVARGGVGPGAGVAEENGGGFRAPHRAMVGADGGDVVLRLDDAHRDFHRRARGAAERARHQGIGRGGVVNHRAGGARAVHGIRRRRAEIHLGADRAHGGGHDFRQHEKIGAAGGDVQALDGEDVVAGEDQRRRDGELGPRVDDRLVEVVGGGGIVGQRGGGVRAADFGAVEPGDEAVLVFHPQLVGRVGGGAGDGKDPAEQDRRVHVLHRGLAVGRDPREHAAVAGVEAEAGGGQCPRGVVEARADVPTAGEAGADVAGSVVAAAVVGLADRAVGEHPVTSALARADQGGGALDEGDAVGDVGSLGGIGGAEGVRPNRRAGGRVRVVEAEEPARPAQAEVGVERCRGVGAVFPGGPDQQGAVGRDGDRGEGPLFLVQAGVGQPPAAEVDRAGAGVQQLDPIRAVAVFVLDANPVVREKLGNDDLRLHAAEGKGEKAGRKKETSHFRR